MNKRKKKKRTADFEIIKSIYDFTRIVECQNQKTFMNCKIKWISMRLSHL